MGKPFIIFGLSSSALNGAIVPTTRNTEENRCSHVKILFIFLCSAIIKKMLTTTKYALGEREQEQGKPIIPKDIFSSIFL